jgi:hypothetical protein
LNRISLVADAFTAGAEQHDDMTLLVMKIKTGFIAMSALSARNSDFSRSLSSPEGSG